MRSSNAIHVLTVCLHAAKTSNTRFRTTPLGCQLCQMYAVKQACFHALACSSEGVLEDTCEAAGGAGLKPAAEDAGGQEGPHVEAEHGEGEGGLQLAAQPVQVAVLKALHMQGKNGGQLAYGHLLDGPLPCLAPAQWIDL